MQLHKISNSYMIKPMKKIVSLFIAVFLFTSSLFAYEGFYWGESELRSVKTQWFEIIYPESSEVSARLLYENADSIYQELSDLYQVQMTAKMPIVIVPGHEQFNAYFSTAYYNHIVLYDTLPNSEMEVFSEDFLSTFRHELTHAFTFNMKNGFWRFIGTVFGDAYSPGTIFVTSGMAEGATLTSESGSGEGRLNDVYYGQMIRQAKIENKYPAFDDMQGARELYPAGAFYNFNGAFHQWLQEEYGMKLYSQWWWNVVNMKGFLPFQANLFKKTYGFSIYDAWSRFRDSIYIPELHTMESLKVKDAFSGKYKASFKNKGGSVYSDLCATEDAVYYVEKKTGAVWRLKNGHRRRLFSFDTLDAITASRDGRYLAIEYWNVNQPQVKARVRLYNTKTRRWFEVETDEGFKNLSLIQIDGKYYLAGVKFKSQNRRLSLYKIDEENNGITQVFETATEELPLNAYVDCITDLGKGKLAWLEKTGDEKGLQWKLIFADALTFKKEKVYLMPENQSFRMTGLSYNPDDDSLYFSWVEKDSLPRLGKFSLSTETYTLWKDDISGGIYNPCVSGGRVYFEGHFFEENRLFVLDELSGNFDQVQALCEGTESEEEESAAGEDFVTGEDLAAGEDLADAGEEQLSKTEEPLPSEKINPFRYYKDGIFIPFSTLSYTDIDIESIDRQKSYSMPIGVTYITQTPWDSNKVTISVGADFNSNNEDQSNPEVNWAHYGASLDIAGGTSSTLFSYDLNLKGIFDEKGFFQAGTGGTGQVVFNAANNLYFLSAGKLSAAFDNTNYFINSQFVNAVSWQCKTGPGMYENLGGVVYTDIIFDRMGRLSNGEYEQAINYSPALNIYIPKLIPIVCYKDFTYNLPVVLKGRLFSNWTSIASGEASIIIFDYQIQKSIGPAFFTAVNLSSGYSGAVGFRTLEDQNTYASWMIGRLPAIIELAKSNRLAYRDEIYGKVTLSAIFFNTDTLKFDFYAKYSWFPYNKKDRVFLGGDFFQVQLGFVIK